ncbi:MAG TPA: 30S ribosomal protein S20 [Gammaproteobacteria bacterium]|nr:30S ribosomal protein S20 [Gammaproteobacteria bacterium]
MANTAQAKKRARQAEKHRQHNMGMRSQLRTSIKKIHTAITANDKKAADTSYHEAQPIIDKMVSKGIIHKNKAARHKSRIQNQLKKMATA